MLQLLCTVTGLCVQEKWLAVLWMLVQPLNPIAQGVATALQWGEPRPLQEL